MSMKDVTQSEVRLEAQFDPGASQAKHPVLDRNERARDAATRLAFDCLDKEWKGWQATYQFRCGQGHLWSTRLSTMVNMVECTQCARARSLERLQAAAIMAGVVCLEQRWLGMTAFHRFRCAQGHEWRRQPRHAMSLADCPQCRRNAAAVRTRLTDGLERLQQCAIRHGGECLSSSFEGVERRYRFRCALGHVWDPWAYDVLRGTWCPRCSMREAGERRRAEVPPGVRERVLRHGGEVLEAVHDGARVSLRLRCQAGHEWTTQASALYRGSWCRACVTSQRRLTLADAQHAAAERGGQCLSTEYRNNTTKMHWLCHRGHAWHAPLGTIRQGHWCPECAHMNRLANRNSKARKRYLASPVSDP